MSFLMPPTLIFKSLPTQASPFKIPAPRVKHYCQWKGDLNWIIPLFVINSAAEFYKWKYIFIMQIIPRFHSNGLVGCCITFPLGTVWSLKKKRFEVNYVCFPRGEKGEENPAPTQIQP